MHLKLCPLLAATLALSGCGTYVPDLQEPPGDSVSGTQLVEAIVHNIRCEVRDAIYALYNNPDHARKSTFLDDWGVQMTLSLQVEEKSGLTPVVNWLPPPTPSLIFNLGFGGTLSADATRIDKMNFYHTVAEYRAAGPCDSRESGQLLLQSDLKLRQWLYDSVTVNDTREGDFSKDTTAGPLKQNVISHEVKFEINTAGSVTPGWKLKTVSINQSGLFATAGRDRTNDLLITLGPAVSMESDKLVGGHLVRTSVVGPSTQAANSHLSSEIGAAVSDNLRDAILH